MGRLILEVTISVLNMIWTKTRADEGLGETSACVIASSPPTLPASVLTSVRPPPERWETLPNGAVLTLCEVKEVKLEHEHQFQDADHVQLCHHRLVARQDVCPGDKVEVYTRLPPRIHYERGDLGSIEGGLNARVRRPQKITIREKRDGLEQTVSGVPSSSLIPFSTDEVSPATVMCRRGGHNPRNGIGDTSLGRTDILGRYE
ncbi:hypothetical protein J6590_081719 [Homalodisca vitripennis]|nr:hypothetical protein J6590_081719 [Homalodisca vitripennis]